MSEWSISISWAVLDPGAAHMSRICTQTVTLAQAPFTPGHTGRHKTKAVKVLRTDRYIYLMVGLYLQEEWRDHADSFLTADVTLEGQTQTSLTGRWKLGQTSNRASGDSGNWFVCYVFDSQTPSR